MIKVRSRLLYSQYCIASSLFTITIITWLFYFYNTILAIPSALLGLFLGLGRLVDAFTDPLFGYLSDKCKSKIGRRKPFIILFPFLVASFLFLWLSPFSTIKANIIYFAIMINIYLIFYTAVVIPAAAMLPEIAKKSIERVKISIFNVLFGIVGGAIAASAGLLIHRFSFKFMALLFGAIAFLSFFLLFLNIKETQYKKRKKGYNFFLSLKTTLTNKNFLFFLFPIALMQASFHIVLMAFPYIVGILLQMSTKITTFFQLLFIITMIACMPLWYFLAKKISNKKLFSTGMILLFVFSPILFFARVLPGPRIIYYIIFIVTAAAGISNMFSLHDAIISRIIDFDAKKTGIRKEAIYYGSCGFSVKASYALAAIIFGFILKPGATAENPLGIRLIGLLVSFFIFIAFLIFQKYKIEK